MRAIKDVIQGQSLPLQNSALMIGQAQTALVAFSTERCLFFARIQCAPNHESLFSMQRPFRVFFCQLFVYVLPKIASSETLLSNQIPRQIKKKVEHRDGFSTWQRMNDCAKVRPIQHGYNTATALRRRRVQI